MLEQLDSGCGSSAATPQRLCASKACANAALPKAQSVSTALPQQDESGKRRACNGRGMLCCCSARGTWNRDAIQTHERVMAQTIGEDCSRPLAVDCVLPKRSLLSLKQRGLSKGQAQPVPNWPVANNWKVGCCSLCLLVWCLLTGAVVACVA